MAYGKKGKTMRGKKGKTMRTKSKSYKDKNGTKKGR